MEPASWHLNLLHVGLGGQWDDGLELGAADSSHSHRLNWFNVLKRFNQDERLRSDGSSLDFTSSVTRLYSFTLKLWIQVIRNDLI